MLLPAALMAQRPAATPPAGTTHAAAPHAAAPASSNPVVLTVGTMEVRADLFNAIIDAAPADSQAAMKANKREVAQELGKMLAIEQEASRRGLDRDPDAAAKLIIDRGNVLSQALGDQLAKQNAPTPAAIQAYYQAHPNEFIEIKARHILVGDSESQVNPRTQAAALVKAQELEARLKTEDFATVAKAESDDKSSGANGGELGVIMPGQTVPEFETAVWALPVGKTSDPILTRFGYHIVQVEQRTPMSLADATPLITEKMQEAAVQQAIERIEASAKVTLNDSYLGPAAPAAPAHPGR